MAGEDPDHTEFTFYLGDADSKQIVKNKNNIIWIMMSTREKNKAREEVRECLE